MNKKGMETLKKEYEEIRMTDAQWNAYKQSIERAKRDNQKRKYLSAWKFATAAVAAVLIVFIILPNTSSKVSYAMSKIPVIGTVAKAVTFREYHYEGETQIADVEIPQIETVQAMPGVGEEAYDGENLSEEQATFMLTESRDEINAEIKELTAGIIADFEAGLAKDGNVKEVLVSYEEKPTTEQYYVLKLMHYESVADGAEQVYYYTVDLTTGEYLELKDLFVEGADYKGVISEEIIRQMRAEMATDSSKHYWLDEEPEDWNFTSVTEDTQFYINENNHVVISFNEGEVAPMYMGVVCFEIPDEIIGEIRR